MDLNPLYSKRNKMELELKKIVVAFETETKLKVDEVKIERDRYPNEARNEIAYVTCEVKL